MMHPPTHCPSCSAPLPPGALQCAYCKAPTPLGMQHAHHQRHFAAWAAAQRQRINLSTVTENAKWALVLSLIGMAMLCCGPISMVGAILGVRALRLAKAERVAAPTRAYVAIVIGCLTMVAFGIGLTAFILDSKKQSDRLEAIQKRLSGKREAQQLDAKTACDLAEERLLEDGYGGEGAISLDDVKCDGALEVQGNRGSLANIRAAFGQKRFQLTACYLRGSRWFVLKLTEAERCGDPAIAPPPGGKLSEEELRAQEKKARADNANAEGLADVKAYIDGLRRIRDRAPNLASLNEQECPKAQIQKQLRGQDRIKLDTVDFDCLDQRSGAGSSKEWAWLTSDRIKRILGDGDAAAKVDTLRDIRREGGSLLVVYRAQDKLWPKVHQDKGILSDDFSYDSGEFRGALLIYDVDTGERLCQAKLAFKNTEKISYKSRGVSSEKTRAADAVEDDFKEQFESTATASLKRIAPELRLGYKVLD